MTASRAGAWHTFLFCLLVGVFATGYATLLALGGGLLGPAWDAGGSEYIHRVHHIGAVLFIALLVIGLLAQLWKFRGQVAAFQQALLAIVALLAAGLVIGDPDNHGGNVGIIDPLMLILAAPMLLLAVLHPVRREVLRLQLDVKPISTTIAAAGAIPLLWYAVDQALRQRNSWPPAADLHHNGHWMMMALLGFAIALIGLLAALQRDSQVPAWSSGVAAIVFGLASALLPDHASSLGLRWGAAGSLWGLFLIGMTQVEARRSGARLRGRWTRQTRSSALR